jgi:transcriptional regulator with XRE-family HTH domain
LDYQDLIVKQLAAKAGVNIHTLNHYLSGKKSMPPADVAVKIATALGVSVEYLVTGREPEQAARRREAARGPGRGEDKGPEEQTAPRFRGTIDDLKLLPEDVRNSIIKMIGAVAGREKKRRP